MIDDSNESSEGCSGMKDEPAEATEEEKPKLINVHEVAPETYDGTCLRPLGLCELGGCCDTCWYRPDHPRFAEKG